MKWWTRELCRTRWERIPTESISPDHTQVPRDADILTQGRGLGSTYAEVMNHDWTYCQWVVSTSQQESSMAWINHFALYILNNQPQSMEAEEEEIQYPEGWEELEEAAENSNTFPTTSTFSGLSNPDTHTSPRTVTFSGQVETRFLLSSQ